ncbi:hypothetical protein NKI38_04915 [Mesorhizobium sp. M0621]|uniref:hypothetical protein n=1 Tax=unclassified Mesorhizobium TaxID=325217 RepID=UPI0033397259
MAESFPISSSQSEAEVKRFAPPVDDEAMGITADHRSLPTLAKSLIWQARKKLSKVAPDGLPVARNASISRFV